jgi:hypothetical protein
VLHLNFSSLQRLRSSHSYPVSLRCFVLLALTALLLANAQTAPQPELRLSSDTLHVTDTLTISGSFFDPDTIYILRLTGPTGISMRSNLDIRDNGDFSHAVQLNAPGQWQIDVQGADVFATLMVQVLPDTDADEPEPATEEPAEDTDQEAEEPADPRDDTALPDPEPTEDASADETDLPLAPAAPTQPDSFLREGNAVIALADNQLVWSLPFVPGALTTEPVVRGDRLYVGHGNSLLEVSARDGVVLSRWPLSGQVTSLHQMDNGLILDLALSDGLTETLQWRDGELESPATFDPDPRVLDFLRLEAEGDISATQDPTNPYLHLQLGQEATDAATAREHFSRALNAAQTFYDLAALSREFVAAGELELANDAFDRALQDFAERGYDPRLLRNPDMHEAYNFPLRPTETALLEGDLPLAGFWANWLQYFVSSDVPIVTQVLNAYAVRLRQSGDVEAANRWRDLARPASGASVRGLVDTLVLRLAEPGWYEVLALLIAVGLLHMVLMIKYWPAQNVNLRRRAAMGRANRPLGRLLIMRYYTITEKLVVMLMMLVTLAIVILATWNNQASVIPPALQSGTFASRAAQHTLERMPLTGDYGALVAGFSAQVRGEPSEAATHYQAATSLVGARNNLAIVTDDPSLFERALELAPLPETRYNLGQDQTSFPFHRRYLPDTLISYIPTEQDLHLAMVGSWQRTFQRLFREPWQTLSDLRPQGLPFFIWIIIVGLLAFYTLYCALWLLVPRMRWVSRAPRPLLYHIAAFFVPGSAMADELWGFLVLLPWTFFSASFLGRFFSTGTVSTGVSYIWDGYILGFIYLLNTVALIFDYRKQKRQLELLRRENPELAQEFGLSPLPARQPKPGV